MSGRRSVHKGKLGATEAFALLGFARNFKDGKSEPDGDLPADYPFVVEVKRTKRNWTGVYKVLEQAQGYEAGKAPMALLRDDRRPWLAVVRLEDWLRLARGGSGEGSSGPPPCPPLPRQAAPGVSPATGSVRRTRKSHTGGRAPEG